MVAIYSMDRIKGLKLRCYFDWPGNWSGAAPLPWLMYPAAVEKRRSRRDI